jgi:hypothetical protein
MLDSGAPTLYNTLVRNRQGSFMGSYLKDRAYDDFSFLTTQSYLDYKEAYIQFILKYQNEIDFYVNLDIINNAEATWENQKYMESFGLHPIPVFHFGCDTVWLEKYLEEGYDYIALGGMIPNHRATLLPGLDYLWEKFLTDSKGYPKVKIHGFAITSTLLMTRWPWFSCDSTSWVKFGKYGIVCIPRKKLGKYTYDESSWAVNFTPRSASRKIENSKHYQSLSEYEQKEIERYVEEKGYKIGKVELKDVWGLKYTLKEGEKWGNRPKSLGEKGSVEVIIEPGIATDYRMRDEMNIIYYQDLAASQPEWPWPFKPKKAPQGLFRSK